MFVVSSTYLLPLTEIDRLLDAHRTWLKTCYAEGLFVASGPKKPRSGGLILARGSRDVLEARLKNDPFVQAGAAEYVITEFVAATVAEGMESLREA